MQNDMRNNQFNKICGSLKRFELSNGDFSYLPLEDLTKVPLGAAGKWLTKDEFAGLVINRVWGVIYARANDDLPDPNSGNFQDIVGESVIHNIANGVIDEINSLPLRYDARISLSNINVNEEVAAEYKGVRISTIRGVIKGLLHDQHKPGFEICLSVNVEGFANYQLDSSAAVKAIESIKVVLNSWLSKRLVYIDRFRASRGGLIFNATTNHVIDKQYIGLISCDAGGTVRAELPLDLTIALLSMQLSDELKSLSPNGIIENLLRNSTDAVDLLSMDSDEARSICAAAEWSFNSHLSENETMSFLQVCFGFEALFGDGDPKSVTKTLANRCAFAVASRVSQRAGIVTQFEKFYQTRSKIVHGRVARLNGDDRALLSWARALLQIAIQSETSRI